MFNEPPMLAFRGPWGVPIEIGMSFLLLPLFFIAFGGGIGSLLWGLVFVAVLALTLLLHELGHAWACHVAGVPVRRVYIGAAGGMTEQQRFAGRSAEELIVAAGPMANLTVWAVLSLAIEHLDLYRLGMAVVLLHMFAWLNLFIALFNLIPVLPLDGGKLFQLALLHFLPRAAAARVAGTVGMICVVLWIPLLYFCWRYVGFILFFFPPVGLHWRMMKGEAL